ncbi:MAG: twin-arginine translocation signal domain-containing protein, partial [Bacteroidota bacterium]
MGKKEPNLSNSSRRSFIKGATLGVAGFYLFPRHVL